MSSFPPPRSAVPFRVAIIGGGISGLATAHRLCELLPQAEIDLFEASNRLGGVLDTVKRSGFLIERSADNFLVKPPSGVDLCRELGMADDLLTTDESRRRAFVVRSGKLIPIPEGFYLMSPRKLWPLLTSPVLSLRGKVRLLMEPLIPRGQLSSAEKKDSAAGDESIAAFARRRLGREAFEQLVQPLVAGIYTADPEKLSMAATMPQFLEYERKSGSLLRGTLRRKHPGRQDNCSIDDTTQAANAASGARYGLFIAPKDGMTSLVSTLASRLKHVRIHLHTRVSTIRVVDNRWLVKSGGAAVDSNSQFDAVVVALPAHAAADILEQCDVELAAVLAAIEYAGCAVVSLGFARSQIGHALDGFGFVVPETERRRIIAGSFASLKFPGRAGAACPHSRFHWRRITTGDAQTA